MDLSNESRQQLQRACSVLGVEFTQRDDVIPAMILAITERLAVLVSRTTAPPAAVAANDPPQEFPPPTRPPPTMAAPVIPEGKKLCPKCNGVGWTIGAEDGIKWGCAAENGGCNGLGYVG
jgi:hypothetical protein